MENYLDIAKEALRQHRAGAVEPGVKNHEFNETNEFTQVCHACLCDGWDVALERCGTCRCNLCVNCDNCLRASLVWRGIELWL